MMGKDLILDQSNIRITVNVKDTVYKNFKLKKITVDKIIGSKTSKLQNKYNQIIFENKSDINKIISESEAIICRNPDNLYSGYLLSNLCLEYKIDKKATERLFALLNIKNQDEAIINNIKKYIYAKQLLKLNDKISDFALLDVDNNLFNTESLKGKWYLLDFWASWCTPCRKSFPELKIIYEKYKSSNFEILGFSIDEDKDKWKMAVKKDNLNWINIIEEKGFLGDIVFKLNIQSVPTTFLINPEGVIVSENLTPEELDSFLQKNLKE
ncbi:TlpA family protein disulfide reductase [Flavobacterium ardleyense]|uniref:TlpA family protein disulfide reductase n=1 Tax=Flavobacterium ardleyense TaxID=2038737 RepID=A0ABW5Z4F2_9FLAO